MTNADNANPARPASDAPAPPREDRFDFVRTPDNGPTPIQASQRARRKRESASPLCQACFGTGMHRRMGENVPCPNGCPVPRAVAAPEPMEATWCECVPGTSTEGPHHDPQCVWWRAASPAQEATPPRETSSDHQQEGWTKNDQPQEPGPKGERS